MTATLKKRSSPQKCSKRASPERGSKSIGGSSENNQPRRFHPGKTTPTENHTMTATTSTSAQQYVDHCLAKRDEARDKAIYSAVHGDPIQAAKDLSSFHAAWALHAQAVGNLA
jgi:hypothetical protein